MEKIVIIGSSGSGKTIFARILGLILQIKVIHLDRVFWMRGWKRKSTDTRIDILQRIIMDKQWIVEGTYVYSSKPALDKADTIIFLDMPSLLCLMRIFKRHHESFERSRRDIPKDCTDRLTLRSIWKVLFFPFGDREAFEQELQNYEAKRIIWLRSPQEADEFLAQLVHEQRPASAASLIKAGLLVAGSAL